MNLGKVEIWETSLDRIVTLREGAKGVLRPAWKAGRSVESGTEAWKGGAWKGDGYDIEAWKEGGVRYGQDGEFWIMLR